MIPYIALRRTMTCICLLTSACNETKFEDSAFVTANAERGDLRDIVQATGEIHEPVEMSLGIKADTVVKEVKVRLGEHVKTGQVLALLAPRQTSDDRSNAVEDVAQAQIGLDIAANRYAKSIATYAGYRKLYEKGFVPTAKLQAEEKELENERLGLKAAERKLSALTTRQDQLNRRLEERDRLRSPCNCTVEDIKVMDGQALDADLADAFYVSGKSPWLNAKIKIPEQDMARVQAASNVRYGVEALPERNFPTEITYLSNRAVKDGRFTYYMVHLRLNRDDDAIRAGMTANVEFVNADSRNVIKVPLKALYFTPVNYVPMMPQYLKSAFERARTDDEKKMIIANATGYEFGYLFQHNLRKVFVLEGGKVVRRLVRVGAETSDAFEAASGIRVGDKIIISQKTSPI